MCYCKLIEKSKELLQLKLKLKLKGFYDANRSTKGEKREEGRGRRRNQCSSSCEIAAEGNTKIEHRRGKVVDNEEEDNEKSARERGVVAKLARVLASSR